MNRAVHEPHLNNVAQAGRWGTSVAIDGYDGDLAAMTDKRTVRRFLRELPAEIDMKGYRRPWVVRFGLGALHGLTGVRLIYTSDITWHAGGGGRRRWWWWWRRGRGAGAADRRWFCDIFTCGPMDEALAEKAAKFTAGFFGGTWVIHPLTERGVRP